MQLIQVLNRKEAELETQTLKEFLIAQVFMKAAKELKITQRNSKGSDSWQLK